MFTEKYIFECGGRESLLNLIFKKIISLGGDYYEKKRIPRS